MLAHLILSHDQFFPSIEDCRDLTKKINRIAPQKNAQYSGWADTRMPNASKYGCQNSEMLDILWRNLFKMCCCCTSLIRGSRSAIIAPEVEYDWNWFLSSGEREARNFSIAVLNNIESSEVLNCQTWYVKG